METEKYTYRLEKEDYMDWLRYEAKEIDNPAGRKKVCFAAVLSVAAVLCAEYVFFRLCCRAGDGAGFQRDRADLFQLSGGRC